MWRFVRTEVSNAVTTHRMHKRLYHAQSEKSSLIVGAVLWPIIPMFIFLSDAMDSSPMDHSGGFEQVLLLALAWVPVFFMLRGAYRRHGEIQNLRQRLGK